MAKRISVSTPIADVYSQKWLVAAGAAATIDRGTPAKAADAATASPWTGAAAIMVDGDGSTSQRFCGVAKSVSTDTAAAAGTVQIVAPLPGIIYKAFALLSTTADTDAEVLALKGKRVVFDLTSTDWTVDAAAADAVANCVTIVDGDSKTQELTFVYSPKGTWLAFGISA